MVFETREPGTVSTGEGFILDNSVAMRWFVASGKAVDQRYALSVRNYIQEKRAKVLVPYLWVYEAANVMAQYVRLDELNANIASNGLIALHELCSVMIARETPLALYELAEVHGLSAYDVAYLLLARSEGLPIATLDKKMRKVAGKMGISIFGVR